VLHFKVNLRDAADAAIADLLREIADSLSDQEEPEKSESDAAEHSSDRADAKPQTSGPSEPPSKAE